MVVTTGRFSASLGDLGVGESTTVVLTIDVNPSLAAPAGAITGSFLASSDLGDLNLENSSVSTSESIAPPVADLSVGLGAPTGPLHVGQVSVWTGTVTNLGPSEPSDVVLTVMPANGLVIVGTSLGSVDPVTGVLVVPLGSLAPGASASVSITVRPTLAGKSATMTATATSSRPDPNPTNNASSASTAILPTGPRVVGPPILSLPRHRPASIFLTFSEPLAPTRARDRRLYRLTSAGRDHVFGTSDDRPVAIRRVTYDPAIHIVRLALASRPQTPLELRILGTGKTPLTGSSGLALDGNYDGVPGGDFLTRIG